MTDQPRCCGTCRWGYVAAWCAILVTVAIYAWTLWPAPYALAHVMEVYEWQVDGTEGLKIIVPLRPRSPSPLRRPVDVRIDLGKELAPHWRIEYVAAYTDIARTHEIDGPSAWAASSTQVHWHGAWYDPPSVQVYLEIALRRPLPHGDGIKSGTALWGHLGRHPRDVLLRLDGREL